MSMRLLRLPLHLTPEHAHTVLELLDQLRELLAEAYGDDIAAMLRAATSRTAAAVTANTGADPPF